MKKLSKRNYPSLTLVSNGKWYTGYSEQYDLKDKCFFSDDHEVRLLRLQYNGFTRGRSAANIIMVDREGFKYMMSLSAFDLLMQVTDMSVQRQKEEGSYDKYDISRLTGLNGQGVSYEGMYCQIKQGQNYFIQPAKVR